MAGAAIGAGPARAENGTGLYAPFPSPSGGPRAERFVGELGVKVSARQLRRGTLVPVEPGTGMFWVGAGPATQRAGSAGGHGTAGLLIGLALAAALGAAILRLAARRRAR